MQASLRTQSGPYQSQVGQASHHSQVASQHSDRNGNQIARRPHTFSQLYKLVAENGKQLQSVHLLPQNGDYRSGQMPNWQTARVPQQTVSSLQVTAGGGSNNYHQGTQDNAAMQASCVNVQSGNHPLPGGINDIPQQAFHQNSSLNWPNPSPPNGIQQNSVSNWNQQVIQQNSVSNWNQQVIKQNSVSNWNQQVPIQCEQPGVAHNVSANCVPLRLQRGDVENASHQNVNRIPVQPPLPLPALAASVQQPHVSYAGTSMSTTTCSQQMAHNHSDGYIINGFQHGVPPHTAAPSQISSSRSHHVMASDSQSGQSLMQSRGQLLQTLMEITGVATSSSHSATHPSGIQHALHGHYMPNSQIVPENANNVNSRQMADSEHCFLKVNNNALGAQCTNGTRLGFIPRDGMTQTGQTVQPEMLSTHERCNSNTHYAVNVLRQLSNPHNSEAPPPYRLVQNGISSNQHTSEAPPPYRPVQNGYDTMEQCRQSSGKTSLQSHSQQSLPQAHAMSSKLNDSSNYTSPGHAGQKAVAIVQPMKASYKDVSSEMSSDQCKRTTITAESGSVHEETSIVKPTTKSTSLTYRQKSMDENVCLEMSTEEGADVMKNHDMGPSEMPLNKEAESQQYGRMQATPTSHQPVTTTEVPSSQSEEMGQTKRQGEPASDEFDLSSVQLIPFTYDMTKTILETCKEKRKSHPSKKDLTVADVASTILSMYWEASYENVLMKTDYYAKLINEAEEFCSKHVAPDSVIFSTISRKSWKTLKKDCYLLSHDAVHLENTYESSWLNTNEQLDDIDKEFGFPWSLTYGLTFLERDEQPTLIETENGVPKHTADELQNKRVPPTEITALSDDQYVEKQASSARDDFNQTPVPLENAMADSIDSSYSFNIQVLPPEEAKILFDQLNSEQAKTEKTEDHSEMLTDGSVEDVEDDLPEIVSVRLGEVKLENKDQAPTQEFCCTTRWMEVMGVSNTRSHCNCQCRREQSADGVNVKSFEEQKAVQTENSHVMTPIKLEPTIESESKVDIGNDVVNQTLTPTWMKQYDDHIDLMEEDEMLHLHTNMEPKCILLSSTPSVDSNIREINDLLPCSEPELGMDNSELEVGCGQSEQKQPCPLETQFDSKRKHDDVSLASQLTSAKKTDKMTFLTSLSLAKKNPCILHPKKNLSFTARRKRKRLAETPGSILPFCKKMRLDRNSQLAPEDNLTPVDEPFDGNDNTDDLEPVHNKVTTVKLVLFGSSAQKEHGAIINGQRSSRSHSMSSQKNLFSNETPLPSNETPQPPTTLSVTVAYLQKRPTELPPMGGSLVMKSPDKQRTSEEPSETGLKLDNSAEQSTLERPSETEPLKRSTVRQRIHDEWKFRLVPTKMKTRGRGRIMTPKKRSFPPSREGRPEKTKAGPPAVTEELPLASEGQSPPGTDETKRSLSAQRREALLNRLRVRVAKSKIRGVTSKKPADVERSKYELGNPVLMPLQENNVLRFSVLPKTFTFDHGPGYTEESTHPELDIPDPGNGKDSKLTAKRCKGAWAPDPAKKYTPLPSPDSQVPKTTAIFQEYQKKYKEKQQPPNE